MKLTPRIRFGTFALVATAALLAAFPFGCSSDEGGSGGGASTTATGSGGSGGTSTATGSGGQAGSTPTCDGTETFCAGDCRNTENDPPHCGKCGNACGATAQCKSSVCEVCPLKLLTKFDYAAGETVFSVTTGDVNGDGKLDLATSTYFDNSVSVLLNGACTM